MARSVNIIFNYALTSIMLTSSMAISQQTEYDFDSLLVHYPQFENLVSVAMDTFKIFGPEDPLEFTVSTDIRALSKNKYKNEYQNAEVIYKLWDSVSISRQIRIKPRGVTRLKICTNPPLWISVKKTREVFELLDGLGKMKFVVPCKGTNVYQEYIYKEYLAYKLYNIITDYSFRVRLIRLNYHDTSNKVKAGSGYTFILESQKSLAKRKESIPIENENMRPQFMDPESAAILYLFQFMIGNTDWSVAGLHNLKLLKTTDVSKPKPIPVAYDFDYSGLVDAFYAIPGTHVDLESVTDRAYLGSCLSNDYLDKTFELFLSKESEVIETVLSFSRISDKSKSHILSYLDEFFAIIKDSKRRENRIVNKCFP